MYALLTTTPAQGPSITAELGQCPKTKFNGASGFFGDFYEDYVLSYVFEGIKKGFYVDVGANNPITSNVTKYFHDRGWRGMNFEPQMKYYKKFLQLRPSDININKAVSDSNKPLTLYIPESVRGWASLDQHIAEVAKTRSPVVSKVEVEVTTLTEAFNEHGVKDIDFINIDVEGYEDKVLRGLDLKAFRPKVIVLESFSPLSAFGYLAFEPIMFENGYRFGMSDELNRYYYRRESPEFGQRFREIRKCVMLDRLMRDKFCQNEDYCELE